MIFNTNKRLLNLGAIALLTGSPEGCSFFEPPEGGISTQEQGPPVSTLKTRIESLDNNSDGLIGKNEKPDPVKDVGNFDSIVHHSHIVLSSCFTEQVTVGQIHKHIIKFKNESEIKNFITEKEATSIKEAADETVCNP